MGPSGSKLSILLEMLLIINIWFKMTSMASGRTATAPVAAGLLSPLGRCTPMYMFGRRRQSLLAHQRMA